MAVTDQQKLDFLLKKIGYTKTKTGSVVGTGAISGTPKQPFAEAIPSPLVVPNSSLWNEAASIPATAPGSDTVQVKVYSTTSALRMTADATSSGQRAYIAYTTYNDTSSARLTNWIDTQFGASYLIKVYKGDPNSGGVALSAAGSGANDGWFFDYSAGVLNFNDTSVPSGVTDTNIYIVGYRYIGQTGAPTSGISTFSNLDLTVERNLDVGKQGGISTFRHNVQLLDNDRLQFGDTQDLQIYHFSATNNNFISGQNNADITVSAREVELMNQNHSSLYFKGTETGSIVYYNNANKLQTRVDGVNVTGTTETDALLVTGVSTYQGQSNFTGKMIVTGGVEIDNIGISSNIIATRSGAGNQLYIDPYPDGLSNEGTVIIKGDLQVDGTQTTVNSSSVTSNESIFRLGDVTSSRTVTATVGTGASVITLDSITGINTGDTLTHASLPGAGRTTVHSYNTGAKTVSIDGVTTAGIATATQIVVTHAFDTNDDRGISFQYNIGLGTANTKEGFFGYDDTNSRWTYVPDATITNGVVSGTKGFLDIKGIYYQSGDFATSGVVYFDSTGLQKSTVAPAAGISTSNAVLTTTAAGTPTWTDTLDGGTF